MKKVEKMDDLISRSKAIRWIKAECNPYGQPTLDYESGIKVIEHLERMSSAEPVRHGKWIDKDGSLATCSERGDRWGVWSVMNYCPHCGARMGGE